MFQELLTALKLGSTDAPKVSSYKTCCIGPNSNEPLAQFPAPTILRTDVRKGNGERFVITVCEKVEECGICSLTFPAVKCKLPLVVKTEKEAKSLIKNRIFSS